MVTKLLMKSLLTKICHKNICHEAKLVSIFLTNFLVQETNSSPVLLAFWEWVCSGEKSEMLYLLCLELGSKELKQGKEKASNYIQHNI